MAEIINHRGCLQFITHRTERYTELEGAELALKGGCRWVQLRMKGASETDIVEVGHRMRDLCDKYEATLIIDDHVELVKEIRADGVHLGLKDMPIDEARQVLGEEYFIGGTANTADDAIKHYRHSADYVGCGPFRFTTTKQNLAPVLGFDGYEEIMARLEMENITMPVVAIGGIKVEDIPAILDTKVDGIALSGTILNAADPEDEMQRIVRVLNSRL